MSANPEITQSEIEKLLKGIKIPSPPQLLADLQMEMSMPDPDLNALADLITKDVGLSGGILKTVNSPYYGKNDVSSISRSVMLLGMQTVMTIVNTICLRDSMKEASTNDDEKFKSLVKFWDSATDVAQCCQIIAKHIRFKQENKAYMVGLFHNAGIPLLMDRFPNYPDIMMQSYAQNDHRIVDIENDQLKTNHAVLSFYTARSWKLPDMLCNVISKHHNGITVLENQSNNLTSDERTLSGILLLAQHIAGLYRILGNQKTDLEWEKIGDNVIEFLGLSEFDYEDLISFTNEQGIGVQSYFI